MIESMKWITVYIHDRAETQKKEKKLFFFVFSPGSNKKYLRESFKVGWISLFSFHFQPNKEYEKKKTKMINITDTVVPYSRDWFFFRCSFFVFLFNNFGFVSPQ